MLVELAALVVVAQVALKALEPQRLQTEVAVVGVLLTLLLAMEAMVVQESLLLGTQSKGKQWHTSQR
jgi:hypothetical protein